MNEFPPAEQNTIEKQVSKETPLADIISEIQKTFKEMLCLNEKMKAIVKGMSEKDFEENDETATNTEEVVICSLLEPSKRDPHVIQEGIDLSRIHQREIVENWLHQHLPNDWKKEGNLLTPNKSIIIVRGNNEKNDTKESCLFGSASTLEEASNLNNNAHSMTRISPCALTEIWLDEHTQKIIVKTHQAIAKLLKFSTLSHHEFQFQNQILQEEGENQLKIPKNPSTITGYSLNKFPDGRMCIFMEAFENASTLEIFGDTPMPLGMFYRIAKQICDGLTAIHETNLFHNDISLRNILYNQQTKKVKICDMGLSSKTLINRAKENNSFAGTPRFMAPEKHQKIYTQLGDIYSLGCVFYKLLSGSHVFEGSNFNNVIRKHQLNKPQTLNSLPGGNLIPFALSNLIDKMLKKNPDERQYLFPGNYYPTEITAEKLTQYFGEMESKCHN